MTKGGAEIQLEDGGWMKFHNAIWELLARANLTSMEFRCLMFLFRKTYGHKKKMDAISLSQWQEGTGIEKRNVKRTLERLEKRNVIICEGGGRGRGKIASYGFNKYFEKWKLDAETPEKVYEHTPNKKVSTDTPFREKKVYGHTPEKVYGHTPTKERKQQAAAGSKRTSEFVQAFEHFMGRMVASPWESEQIEEWENRVTVEAWRQALQKCAESRPTSFWRYIKPILEDYEVNGHKKQKESEQSSVLDISWGDILK